MLATKNTSVSTIATLSIKRESFQLAIWLKLLLAISSYKLGATKSISNTVTMFYPYIQCCIAVTILIGMTSVECFPIPRSTAKLQRSSVDDPFIVFNSIRKHLTSVNDDSTGLFPLLREANGLASESLLKTEVSTDLYACVHVHVHNPTAL